MNEDDALSFMDDLVADKAGVSITSVINRADYEEEEDNFFFVENKYLLQEHKKKDKEYEQLIKEQAEKELAYIQQLLEEKEKLRTAANKPTAPVNKNPSRTFFQNDSRIRIEQKEDVYKLAEIITTNSDRIEVKLLSYRLDDFYKHIHKSSVLKYFTVFYYQNKRNDPKNRSRYFFFPKNVDKKSNQYKESFMNLHILTLVTLLEFDMFEYSIRRFSDDVCIDNRGLLGLKKFTGAV